jgi:hypothetical protein
MSVILLEGFYFNEVNIVYTDSVWFVRLLSLLLKLHKLLPLYYLALQEFICAGGCGGGSSASNSSTTIIPVDFSSAYMYIDANIREFKDANAGRSYAHYHEAGRHYESSSAAGAVERGEEEQEQEQEHEKEEQEEEEEDVRICHGGVNDGLEYGTCHVSVVCAMSCVHDCPLLLCCALLQPVAINCARFVFQLMHVAHQTHTTGVVSTIPPGPSASSQVRNITSACMLCCVHAMLRACARVCDSKRRLHS